ncbi:PHKA_B [Acanthosepion pharaonis]|uniref:Phosphorylase b kinase regulatory subunit n=1 Tax=Acanthosepion pharaonis TaxID=158019 RepID=A0A812BUA0_ACAPH|nr:PHKA_B [Sepia pharaonis]
MADTRLSNYEATVEKLNKFYFRLKHQILQYQSLSLGLYPECGTFDPEKICKHANVRDSIYCAAATWSLSQAYRHIDDDKGRTQELAQSAVKTMRGILYCWMHQTVLSHKVEKFKYDQNPINALHTVFDIVTGDPVYKDDEYGHLQIDVIGLYLIFLVQMISSGLQVIFSTDEVNFVQNLVFSVERAYRTPDYGMWERGTKYNNGSTEIHASSVGFAKAALESITGLNVFGDQGAAWSVIYIDIDAHNRNRTIFETILPRESNSKNTDASLLPTVSWPAFGIHEQNIHARTISKVLRKLKGKYGVKRFLRDGFKTVLEDPTRKQYFPAEIKNFDGIECEWPMFFAYLMIDSEFSGSKEDVETFYKLLTPLLKDSEYGPLIPKYYYVPKENIQQEQKNPGREDLLNIHELDPIRRYLPAPERPRFSSRYSAFQGTPDDLVIQMVLISESAELQQLLGTYGIESQTPRQIEPIQIWSPKELTKAYGYLGSNKKLGISGRPQRPFGVLSTSKIYRICGQTVLCYPLLFELSNFYLAQDLSLVVDDCKSDLAFLANCWKLYGRPTFCMVIRHDIMSGDFSYFLELLSELKRGDCSGLRVRFGRLQAMISSACIEHLDFLHSLDDLTNFKSFEEKPSTAGFTPFVTMPPPVAPEVEEVLNVMDLTIRSTNDLIQMLRYSESIRKKVQILSILLEREGLEFHVEEYTVKERLEKTLHLAGTKRQWAQVRLCAALLDKVVDSLAPSITSVLVRGKQLTVGVFAHEETVLDKPIPPSEIKEIIYSCCKPHNLSESVLQQEIIINIGKLISTSPQFFAGILKIRIGWFIYAMKLELSTDKSMNPDIFSLSPRQIRTLLLRLLKRNMHELDKSNPLMRRQIDGALNRVPKNFYDQVWNILEKTPGGVKVVGYLLPQQPTLSDMTMYEMNFSLLVEKMLSRIVDPAYRQIMVESFMVVATILDRNPELHFPQAVNMDKILDDAFAQFKDDKLKEGIVEKEKVTMHMFISTQANVRQGTTSYIAKSVLKQYRRKSLFAVKSLRKSFIYRKLKRSNEVILGTVSAGLLLLWNCFG